MGFFSAAKSFNVVLFITVFPMTSTWCMMAKIAQIVVHFKKRLMVSSKCFIIWLWCGINFSKKSVENDQLKKHHMPPPLDVKVTTWSVVCDTSEETEGTGSYWSHLLSIFTYAYMIKSQTKMFKTHFFKILFCSTWICIF